MDGSSSFGVEWKLEFIFSETTDNELRQEKPAVFRSSVTFCQQNTPREIANGILIW